MSAVSATTARPSRSQTKPVASYRDKRRERVSQPAGAPSRSRPGIGSKSPRASGRQRQRQWPRWPRLPRRQCERQRCLRCSRALITRFACNLVDGGNPPRRNGLSLSPKKWPRCERRRGGVEAQLVHGAARQPGHREWVREPVSLNPAGINTGAGPGWSNRRPAGFISRSFQLVIFQAIRVQSRRCHRSVRRALPQLPCFYSEKWPRRRASGAEPPQVDPRAATIDGFHSRARQPLESHFL